MEISLKILLTPPYPRCSVWASKRYKRNDSNFNLVPPESRGRVANEARHACTVIGLFALGRGYERTTAERATVLLSEGCEEDGAIPGYSRNHGCWWRHQHNGSSHLTRSERGRTGE